jgi:hypothetical protein
MSLAHHNHTSMEGKKLNLVAVGALALGVAFVSLYAVQTFKPSQAVLEPALGGKIHNTQE